MAVWYTYLLYSEPGRNGQSYLLGCGSGSESKSEEVSASDLANSLIASIKAMNVLGSALADQVVGALQGQSCSVVHK